MKPLEYTDKGLVEACEEQLKRDGREPFPVLSDDAKLGAALSGFAQVCFDNGGEIHFVEQGKVRAIVRA
jgi:hypothetical protein